MINKIYATFVLVCLAIVLSMSGILVLEHFDFVASENAEALTRVLYTFGLSLIGAVMISVLAGAMYFIFLEIKDELTSK
jgi:6,7-dimethyl-8-ribityllumazine synthase